MISRLAAFAAVIPILALASGPAGAWYFNAHHQSARGAQRCGNTWCNLRFRQLDLNHDGRITINEFDTSNLPSTLFNAIDTNDDGIISPAEIRAWNLKTRRAHP